MSALPPPRVLLLDMGGVLLDLGGANGLPEGREDWRGRQALLSLVRERGGRCEQEDLERWLFTPWRAEYQRRYERLHEARWEPHMSRMRRESGARGRTLDFLQAWFEPFADTARLLPGVRGALASLAARTRLGLVSNVPLPGVLYRRILSREGVARHFDDLRFSYDEGSRKPSPAMLRSALVALGVRPREAWMVGDRRSSDVAAGRSAGVHTVWIASSFREGPAPDATIASLAELPGLLGEAP